MSVLITGANGFLGRHLSRHLQTTAHRVIPAVRSADCATELAAFGVDTKHLDVYGDMAAPINWHKHLQGVEQVVHCAGMAHRPDVSGNAAIMDAINTQATVALAKAASECGVKRFVFISSVSVYGVAQSDICIDERLAPAPSSAYGRSKWRAEQLLREISYATGIEVVIIRPALTFAYDAPANVRKLIKLAATPLWSPFARVDNHRQLLSVNNFCDFVGALCELSLATADSVDSRVHTVNLADSQSVSLAEMFSALREGMGMQPKLFSVPPAWLRAGFKLAGKTTQAQQLFGDLRISNQRACELLNWTPRYHTLDALRETGAEYKLNRPIK